MSLILGQQNQYVIVPIVIINNFYLILQVYRLYYSPLQYMAMTSRDR